MPHLIVDYWHDTFTDSSNVQYELLLVQKHLKEILALYDDSRQEVCPMLHVIHTILLLLDTLLLDELGT